MNHGFQTSGDSGVLSLSGSLTIETGAELKASIAAALDAVNHVTFDLSGVESADICILQLLCSTHKTALRAGKAVELGATSEGFDASVKEAGYGRHVGCLRENTIDCLWIDDTGEKTEVAQ